MTDQKQDPLDDDDFDELDDEVDEELEAEAEAQRSGAQSAKPAGPGREAAAGRRRFGGRGGAPAPAPGRATPSEAAVHVGDRWSTYFVIGAVAIFLLILLNGILLGQGGAFRPIPTPTPIVTPVPTARPSATVRPSTTPGPSATATASPSATSTATSSAPASPTASPAPSAPPSGQ